MVRGSEAGRPCLCRCGTSIFGIASSECRGREGLLPGVTSAGLASSFNKQRSRFEGPQKQWLQTFVVCIGVLVLLAIPSFLSAVGVSWLALMLSVLFFFASRDPVRNVAVVNALIVVLCILAITPLLSLYTLDIRRLYPSYLIWGRSLIRLGLAAVLYFLRPRGTLGGQGY